jgi:hypothetical protein
MTPNHSSEEPTVGEWRPIESAPKDGSSILVWWPDWQKREMCSNEPVVAWWTGTWWQAGNYWCDPSWALPIRWMPLPPPPKEKPE